MSVGFGQTVHVYANKTRAELAELADQGVITAGNAFASVLLIKGVPNEGESQGDPLLGGTDGKALRAALSALGYAPEDWCALACWLRDGGFLSPEQLRYAFAVLDPATVILCDDAASALVRDAFVDDVFGLEEGKVRVVRGMRMLSLGGFEDALAAMPTKQIMWARLKQVPPLGEPY